MNARLSLVALLALPVTNLAAQSPSRLHFEVQLDGSEVYANPTIGSVSSTLSGMVFGGEGRVALGPVGLDLGYWQGSLSTQSGLQPNEDVVEGKALLELAPIHWFTIAAGPYARAYTTTGGTERWLSWRVQGRVEQPLVPETVRAYAELWFTPIFWPDFDREHLYEAIRDYQKRDRRFGRVPDA